MNATVLIKEFENKSKGLVIGTALLEFTTRYEQNVGEKIIDRYIHQDTIAKN